MSSATVTIRRARQEDLAAIVALLANDPLGARRETPGSPPAASYSEAFAAIERDPNQTLIVGCRGDAVVGVLQLTFLPHLTYRGGWRAQIEGVRVAAQERSRGLGRQMIEWAVECARARGCHMVQLTTDKTRLDAKRFYESIGFVASHEGMKLDLARDEQRAALG